MTDLLLESLRTIQKTLQGMREACVPLEKKIPCIFHLMMYVQRDTLVFPQNDRSDNKVGPMELCPTVVGR